MEEWKNEEKMRIENKIYMMKFRSYQTLIFVMCSVLLQAQDIRDTVNFSLNAAFNAGMGDTAPFLSTANQYDRYSFAPNSLSMWGTIHKEIKDASAFDYGFGLELDGNVAKTEKRFFRVKSMCRVRFIS